MYANMYHMNIKEKILEILNEAPNGVPVHEIASQLNAQRTYISKILSDLIQDSTSGVAKERRGREVMYYLSNRIVLIDEEMELENISEHGIMFLIRNNPKFTQNLSESAVSIFEYAFSEMLNNAIEHSESKKCKIRVEISDGQLKFWIRDYGIGVFRNVMQKKHLPDELTAVQELLKGKTTTAAHAHSGEGIFFTSKVADVYSLVSYGRILRVDNLIPDIFVQKDEEDLVGTEVFFQVRADSNKHVSDIFRSFALNPEDGEGGFDVTSIHVKLYMMGSIYVSRSQARRILAGLEKYKKIVLDFKDVPTVGQAFADEIFRVFAARHPEIIVESVNMNEEVKFMIDRARAESFKH